MERVVLALALLLAACLLWLILEPALWPTMWLP
jgi:hypothetical protein